MSLEVYCEGENNLLDYARRSSPPPFLLKTHMVVEDPSTDNIISWNDDGTAFVVWKTTEFARDVLPTLFKHNNFSSFVRQLNTYGFRKITSGRWEFYNDMFRRGERELLYEIRRRKAWTNKIRKAPSQTLPQESVDDDRGSPSTSSLSDYEVLCNENNRLKTENNTLCFELANVKNKCKELLDLVTLHTNLENKEVDERPKLFGVRLDVGLPAIKKARVEIDESLRILLLPPCKSGSF